MYSLFHLKWRFMKPFSKLRAETRRALVTEKETYELPLWALEIASSNANPKWNWLYDASCSTVASVKKHMLFHIIIFHIMCVHMRTHTRTCAYIYTLISRKGTKVRERQRQRKKNARALEKIRHASLFLSLSLFLDILTHKRLSI